MGTLSYSLIKQICPKWYNDCVTEATLEPRVHSLSHSCLTMRCVHSNTLPWGRAETKVIEGGGTGHTALNACMSSSGR